MNRQHTKAFATIGVVILVGVVLVMSPGLSNSVTAQESDDAPPSVSVRQSDNATSTPIIISPSDSGDACKKLHETNLNLLKGYAQCRIGRKTFTKCLKELLDRRDTELE